MAKGFKTGGREQGTPNKLTKELRTALKNILANELENIPEQLNKLEPKDRLEILVKLLPYAVSKLESVNIESREIFDMANIDPFSKIRENAGLPVENKMSE